MATALEENEANPLLGRSALTSGGQRRIVELFATFHSVSQIRDILKSETGHDIHPNTIAYYDPSRSPRLSRRLKGYAAEVRQRYIASTMDVAIAHQAHRLRRYEDIADKALKAKDFNAALKAMELAAKDLGGVLAGQQTVKHTGTVGHVHASVEDMRSEVAMRLAQYADSMPILAASVGDSVGTVTEALPDSADISDT